jgi:hypothetical protein
MEGDRISLYKDEISASLGEDQCASFPDALACTRNQSRVPFEVHGDSFV